MRGLTAHFCFLSFRYFYSIRLINMALRSLSFSSLPIPVMRQFLDIVYQTE
jgi:hypothetical protein